ncbi:MULTISPECIES: DUF1659 domain-containing protein [Aneurinibacillus]|jgi:hypothetical protein|uniref:DUF1659 domain-containing protein n=1 Tax=Aneurinibacillus danicus TaxID=267746 RepID=A0A511VC89_9BACL|nr:MULTISPECIES: DUF1659 domain-containing protein [Aneurinibacillus]GEN36526.1 hypothetical protein ADA01nite_39860 [Aneurinibacillus danicus]
MAVTGRTTEVQMVLLFQDGVDAKGNVKLAKKIYKNVAPSVSGDDIHEIANALAGLQTLPFAGVQQVVVSELTEE